MFEDEPVTEVTIDCPYCGSSFSVLVSTRARASAIIEDCAVCCQPIEFHLREQGNGELELFVARGDDTF